MIHPEPHLQPIRCRAPHVGHVPLPSLPLPPPPPEQVQLEGDSAPSSVGADRTKVNRLVIGRQSAASGQMISVELVADHTHEAPSDHTGIRLPGLPTPHAHTGWPRLAGAFPPRHRRAAERSRNSAG